MANASILIVDDNPTTLMLIERYLMDEDYTILTASSGAGTLRLVAENPGLDMILLDVQLPDIDGIEVCRELKSSDPARDIPVVLISAVHTDDPSIQRGLEMGAVGYLTHPIDRLMLRAWVKATLRIGALERNVKNDGFATLSDDELLARFSKLSHKVNNPLQALYAAADMLSANHAEAPDTEALLNDIFVYAEKVAAMVAEASHEARSYLSAPTR